MTMQYIYNVNTELLTCKTLSSRSISYLKYPMDFFIFPFFLVARYSVYELFPFIPFNPSPLSPKKSVIAATVDIGKRV